MDRDIEKDKALLAALRDRLDQTYFIDLGEPPKYTTWWWNWELISMVEYYMEKAREGDGVD